MNLLAEAVSNGQLVAVLGAVGAILGSMQAWSLRVFKQAVGRGPTREEVSEMIQKESPYVRDRELLLKSQRDAAEERRELRKQVMDLVQAVTRLVAQNEKERK